MTVTDIGIIILALTLVLGLTIVRLYLPLVGCPHSRVRCTHGDEIIERGFKRRVCLDCGRALDGPLPDPCAQTGLPHHRATGPDDWED